MGRTPARRITSGSCEVINAWQIEDGRQKYLTGNDGQVVNEVINVWKVEDGKY
jgi:hypothetical protein